MINSTIRKSILGTVAILTIAASGISTAQAGKGGYGGHGGKNHTGMGIYFIQKDKFKTHKLDCSYRNKWVLNTNNQLVLAKVRYCYQS